MIWFDIVVLKDEMLALGAFKDVKIYSLPGESYDGSNTLNCVLNDACTVEVTISKFVDGDEHGIYMTLFGHISDKKVGFHIFDNDVVHMSLADMNAVSVSNVVNKFVNTVKSMNITDVLYGVDDGKKS